MSPLSVTVTVTVLAPSARSTSCTSAVEPSASVPEYATTADGDAAVARTAAVDVAAGTPCCGASLPAKKPGMPTPFTAMPTSAVSASSSTMVPVAVASASSAFDDGAESVTVKVSSVSASVSSAVATVNIVVVAPAGTTTMAVVVAPRSAATAVLPLSIDAVQVAVTCSVPASDSVAVNCTPSASVPEASATLSVGFVPLATGLVAALASVFAKPPASVQSAFAASVAPRSAATTV